MKEWSKDQEQYTEREFQRVQKLKQDQREHRELKQDQIEPREEVAVDPGSREEHYQRALKLLRGITVANRDQTQEELMKLQISAVEDAHSSIQAEKTRAREEEERRVRALQKEEEEEIQQAKQAREFRKRALELKRADLIAARDREIEEEMAEARAERKEKQDTLWKEIKQLEEEMKPLEAKQRAIRYKHDPYRGYPLKSYEVKPHEERVKKKLEQDPEFQELSQKIRPLSMRAGTLRQESDTIDKVLGCRYKATKAKITEKYRVALEEVGLALARLC
jgi:hypothetical protein